MDEAREYELVEAEYRRVYEMYQAASEEMLALAADPDARACDFRSLASRVSRLATQLSTLRITWALLYPKSAPNADEQTHEGWQWLPT